jgi:hypothetical protein
MQLEKKMRVISVDKVAGGLGVGRVGLVILIEFKNPWVR